MTNSFRYMLVLIPATCILAGCSLLPSGQAIESAKVVYSAGSKQHTAAVQIPIPASEVYAVFVRLLVSESGLEFENRNDQAFLIEVAKDGKNLTGQVTKLGAEASLLYVWADAGESGITGQELAISVVERVCDELGVEYELVNY